MISLFLSIPLTLISVAGLILNTYILIVVLLTRQITSANNILLLHLGAVDVASSILYLLFWIPGIKGSEWVTAGTPCIIYGFFYTLLHPIALWTICGLNCDRYYAIAAPLHYTHIVSPRKVLCGLGLGWIISVILCIPPFFTVAPYSYIPGLGACAPNFSFGVGTLWYSTLYAAFTLLLPATVIICCNLKILMIARYHRHRIASAIYEVTLSAQVTITHQRNPFFVPTVTAPSSGGPKFRGRSAIYTVFQLVGSFLLMYLPYYTITLWEATIGSFNTSSTIPEVKLHPHFYTFATAMLVLSLPINGFLYGIKSKTLKKTFQNYWRKKQTKSEVNQEIQARTPSTCGSRRPSLTPLGFLTRPTIQRRLSETLLDVHKAVKSPHKTKIKRIASELTWRPSSANSLNLSPKDDTKKIQHTTSCNTLQVPTSDRDDITTITEEEMYKKLKNQKEPIISTSPFKSCSTNLLLQKFFGIEQQEKLNNKKPTVVEENSPKRSPRILITRAFSEESDKNSHPTSPSKNINKKHSSSATTLLERKWRQLRYKDDDNNYDYDSDGQKSVYTTKPLLDNSSLSNRSSDSSETSETSSGKIFMTMDNKMLNVDGDHEANEDQLLLSWPPVQSKKYIKEDGRKKSNLLKQTLVNVQSQEVVL